MGLLIGILVMGVFILLGLGMNWVSSRYFGSKMVGRGQLISSIRENDRLKFNLHSEDPELVDKAIKECKRKKYVKTPENIYRELDKLKYPKKPNSMIVNSINKVSEIIKSQSDLSKLINKSWTITSQNRKGESWIFSEDNKLIISIKGNIEIGSWNYFEQSKTMYIEIGKTKSLFNNISIERSNLNMKREGSDELTTFKKIKTI